MSFKHELGQVVTVSISEKKGISKLVLNIRMAPISTLFIIVQQTGEL